MPFPRVSTRAAVSAALDECDELGLEAFVHRYHFGLSDEYLLHERGLLYPSKAILAVAHRYEHPDQGAMPNDFSGGTGVRTAFERIGFEVIQARSGGDFLKLVASMAVARKPDGSPYLFKPLLLLLVMGKQLAGDESSWGYSTLEGEFADLVRRYAPDHNAGNLAEPWWSLPTSGLWEIRGQDGVIVRGAGSSPGAGPPTAGVLREQVGAFPVSVREALEHDNAVSATAATLLLHKFFSHLDANQRVELVSAAGLRLPMAWAFLANPDRYDVDGALRALKVVQWTVSSHLDRMRVGDRVYLWRSGSAAGIIGYATIKRPPEILPLDPADEPFVRDREELTRPGPRAILAVDRILDPALSKAQIQRDPRLADLAVMKARGGTNFAVTSAEDEALRQMISRAQDGDAFRGRVWWVNQGATWQAEMAGEYLWAPQRSKNGRVHAHWTSMTQVAVDDRVVHYANGFIRAVSTVTAEAVVGDRPAELSEAWDTDGYLVKSAYTVLRSPVALAGIDLSVRRAEVAASPFDVNGKVKQGYLYPVAEEIVDGIAAASTELAELLFSTARPPIKPPSPHDVMLEEISEQFAETLLVTKAWLQDIVEMLREKRQVIFYGPPGTGKTYVARALVDYLTEQGGSYEIVQFHPSYGYEDFIEGFRPAPTDEGVGVTYEIRWGPLRQIVARAIQEPDVPHFLIIDEINRGNLPKILGELLYLLEYRGDSLALQYSPNERFALPDNLFLIGTMNTADRSIALVDQALRRRFLFKEFNPTLPPVSDVLPKWLKNRKHPPEAAQLLAALNAELEPFDVSIGPSYFMPRNGGAPDCERIWDHSIVPLLQEYFFGSPTDLQRFTLKTIQTTIHGDAPTEEADETDMDDKEV